MADDSGPWPATLISSIVFNFFCSMAWLAPLDSIGFTCRREEQHGLLHTRVVLLEKPQTLRCPPSLKNAGELSPATQAMADILIIKFG